MQIGFCFIAASCSRCLPKILLRFLTVVGLLMLGSPQVTYGQESVTGFKEWYIIGFDRVDLLKP